jgi:hypothetical protein
VISARCELDCWTCSDQRTTSLRIGTAVCSIPMQPLSRENLAKLVKQGRLDRRNAISESALARFFGKSIFDPEKFSHNSFREVLLVLSADFSIARNACDTRACLRVFYSVARAWNEPRGDAPSALTSTRRRRSTLRQVALSRTVFADTFAGIIAARRMDNCAMRTMPTSVVFAIAAHRDACT